MSSQARKIRKHEPWEGSEDPVRRRCERHHSKRAHCQLISLLSPEQGLLAGRKKWRLPLSLERPSMPEIARTSSSAFATFGSYSLRTKYNRLPKGGKPAEFKNFLEQYDLRYV